MNTQAISQKTTLRTAFEALLGAAFIGLLAQVSIPLPMTTVPFSLLNGAILFLCLQFGAKRAFQMIVTYIALGAVTPLFFPMISASAGLGFMRLIGPHGGYYLGFLILPFITGALYKKTDGLLKRSIATSIGMIAVLTLGTAYLSLFIGMQAAIVTGFLQFLIVDLIKGFGLAALIKK